MSNIEYTVDVTVTEDIVPNIDMGSTSIDATVTESVVSEAESEE